MLLLFSLFLSVSLSLCLSLPPSLSSLSPTVLVTLINVYSLKLTAAIMNVAGIAKVSGMIIIIVIGIWQYFKGGKNSPWLE